MSNQPETNETPANGYTPAPRKVGLPRFFELLGRDLWAFYRASFLCLLGFLPGTALAVFGQMGGSALLTVLGGLLGGLIGGPFLSGMIDSTLRALRDEPGYWWHTYTRAWKQNWKQICSNSRFPFWRSTINATCTCQNNCQIEQLQSVQKLDSTFRNSKKKWLPAIRNKHQKQAVPYWEILSSRTTSFYWSHRLMNLLQRDG